MGGGTICPQLTFQVFGFTVVVFPAVHKAILPATFSGHRGSGGQELPELHPVGAGPLPLFSLCSGSPPSTPPPPCTPHRAELSPAEWEPLPQPSLPPAPAFGTRWLLAGKGQYFPKYNLYVIWVGAPGVTLGQFARSDADSTV